MKGAASTRHGAGPLSMLCNKVMLAGAHSRHAGIAGAEHGAAVGDRVMELFERQPDHRKVAVLDGAVVVAIERVTLYAIRRVLHLRQLFRRFRLAHP